MAWFAWAILAGAIVFELNRTSRGEQFTSILGAAIWVTLVLVIAFLLSLGFAVTMAGLRGMG